MKRLLILFIFLNCANVFAMEGPHKNKIFLEAAADGNYEQVESMLKEGIQVNCFGESGTTALMNASFSGHYQICKLLIAHGANINLRAKNLGGYTALIFAARLWRDDIIRLLLENGADATVKDDFGYTALDQWINNWINNYPKPAAFDQAKYDQIRKLFEKAIAGKKEQKQEKKSERHFETFQEEPENGFHFLLAEKLIDLALVRKGVKAAADEYCNPESYRETADTKAKKLLSYFQIAQATMHDISIDIHAVYPQIGGTLLHKAAGEGHIKLVQFLIDHKAHINIKNDYYGLTPLHQAIRGWIPERHVSYFQTIQALLKAQANPNTQDQTGKTVLHWFAQKLSPTFGHDYPQSEAATILELLLQYGARREIKDEKNKTAYDHLPDIGYENIRALLRVPKQIIKPHYITLKVEPTATQAEIRFAYLNLAKQYHPDKANDNNLTNGEAQKKFIDLKNAYEVLSDPPKRKEYDKSAL